MGCLFLRGEEWECADGLEGLWAGLPGFCGVLGCVVSCDRLVYEILGVGMVMSMMMRFAGFL